MSIRCTGPATSAYLSHIVEDLYEGIPSRAIENIVHIAKSEAHGYGHEETKNAVEAEGPQHSFRERPSCIFHLFRPSELVRIPFECDTSGGDSHVHCAVKANQRHDRTQQANHKGCAFGIPASCVRKLCEDIPSVRSRRKYP